MREDIISFVNENKNLPFLIDMTGVSYCDGTYHIYRRNSNILCIEYIISGTGTVEIDGKSFYPSSGDIYILPFGHEHNYYSDNENPWTKIWFNVRGALAAQLYEIYGLDNNYHIKGLNLYPMFKEFLDTAQSKSLSENEIFGLNAIIFHKIIQKISVYLKKDDVFSMEALILKEYLDRYKEKNISIDELSKLIYRSKSQTARIFKTAYGVTPYDYALNKKMETAKLLLKNTNMFVKEISYQLGFSDEHYFSGFFKRKTGFTPKEFRKMR